MKTQTLKYKNYEGSIDVSVEDRCLFGKILFIQDRVIYEGNSIDELENNFREAVDDYIQTCEGIGKEPEKPFSGQFQVRIRKDLHRDAVKAAWRQGVSMNSFVERAIEKEVLNLKQTIRHGLAQFYIGEVSLSQDNLALEENAWAPTDYCQTCH